MTLAPPCTPRSTADLEIIARELALISDRLLSAARDARALALGTDWHSRAASAFHAKAEAWAGDVSSLGCLAETARIVTVRARDAVVARNEWGCS